MTSRERFKRMYEHREADRVPINDSAWSGTIARWQREGMPVGADWREFFDVDKMEGIGVDTSPRFEVKVLEETERYRIFTTEWGVTLKQFKEADSTPEFLDFTIKGPDEWEQAKKRMAFDPERVNVKSIKEAAEGGIHAGSWVHAVFWFGFDITHSWVCGTETILIALLEQPEWVMDMFDTCLSRSIQYFDYLWDNGVRFDEVFWPDDMGYKGTPFFSNELYRQVIKPYHKRAVEWAHNHGIVARLHSCGDIMPLIPDILDTGIDALNPLEVKAGMDAFALKRDYGDRLVLHGGVNAVLWDDREAIIEEIRRVVPVLKENGGYIFASDHSSPSSVSLENFRDIIAAAKQAGAY